MIVLQNIACRCFPTWIITVTVVSGTFQPYYLWHTSRRSDARSSETSESRPEFVDNLLLHFLHHIYKKPEVWICGFYNSLPVYRSQNKQTKKKIITKCTSFMNRSFPALQPHRFADRWEDVHRDGSLLSSVFSRKPLHDLLVNWSICIPPEFVFLHSWASAKRGFKFMSSAYDADDSGNQGTAVAVAPWTPLFFYFSGIWFSINLVWELSKIFRV